MTSLLNDLEAAVQARRLTGTCDMGWRTIAAFDSRRIAERYRTDCARNADFEYRVVDITKS